MSDRAWVEKFRAQQRGHELLRVMELEEARSSTQAERLAKLELARGMAELYGFEDPLREHDVAVVRSRWTRLREPYAPSSEATE